MAKTNKALQGFFCVVLVCVLIFNCFAVPRAEALTAEMTLGVAVTALVCLIISSLGVTIQAAQGQDVTDYVGSYFTSWVQQKGYNDVGSWFTAVTGVSVVGWICKVGAGFLAVGKLVYDAVSQFVSYFVAEQGIESGGEPVGDIGEITSGSTPMYYGNSFAGSSTANSITLPTQSNVSVYADDYQGYGAVNRNAVQSVTFYQVTAGYYNYHSKGTNEYYAVLFDYVPTSRADFKFSYTGTGHRGVYALNSAFISSSEYTVNWQYPIKYIALCIRPWNAYGGGTGYVVNITRQFQLSFSLSLATPGALFTPGDDVLGLPQISDDQSYRIIDSDIAVSAGVAGNLANIINNASTSEGIQTSAAVDDSPVNPPDTNPIEGLQDVFPFCLPFDFARFLQILSAEREAPHFDWIIPIPAATGLGIEDQYITIDLSDFDELAATVRNVELIAMCVGLILLTRELLKW